MTRAQEQMQHAKIDAAAEKDIPASAWEQMRHKPYERRGKERCEEHRQCMNGQEERTTGIPVLNAKIASGNR